MLNFKKTLVGSKFKRQCYHSNLLGYSEISINEICGFFIRQQEIMHLILGRFVQLYWNFHYEYEYLIIAKSWIVVVGLKFGHGKLIWCATTEALKVLRIPVFAFQESEIWNAISTPSEKH